MVLNIRDKFTSVRDLRLFNCKDKLNVVVSAGTNFRVTCLGVSSENSKICWEVFFKDSSDNCYLIESTDLGFDEFLNSIKIA